MIRRHLTRRAALAQAAAMLALPSLANAEASGVREHLDLAYYDGPDADPQRHKLNLLMPASASRTRPAPVLLWYPGGAWAAGSRAAETALARRFAEAGVAAAAVDHRMSMNPFPETPQPPGVHHPAHMQDCARATAWVIAHANDYNLDTNNVFIGGFSSGAHLAALMVMDPHYLSAVGVQLSQIRAATPVSGAYDVPRYYVDQIQEAGQAFADRHVGGVFGPRENWRAASPNSYVDRATVPMLVLADSYTTNYTRWFEDDVVAAGKSSLIQFRYFANLDHSHLYFDMRDNAPSPARTTLTDYILQHVRR